MSDEGHFYCKSCHNVIERTRDVIDQNFTPGSTRISTIGRGSRIKTSAGSGRAWLICEGFQFILRKQADSLLMLGVAPHFRDEVLCQLWRSYLQKSQQAYTHNPVHSTKLKMNTDGEADLFSTAESSSDWSLCSGPADALTFLTVQQKQSSSLLSMRKTLAFIHLALLWCRETLSLSDLLRLVNEGLVPYVNAYELLPEEMQMVSRDAVVFRVQNVPSYRILHQEAQTLAHFLQLPAFPPISQQSLLHPAMLSLRYLLHLNLPDDFHIWVCRVMQRAAMTDPMLHTFHPQRRSVLPRYDLQAAALIIVTMKLLFGMDDHTEWNLSNDAGNHDDTGNRFNVRRWYRLLQAALIRAQHRQQEDTARKQWIGKKPLCESRKQRNVLMKKKRVAEQVQICFEKLSARPAGVQSSAPSSIQSSAPSSFSFCWGDQDGSDGPSMHHMRLDRVVTPCNPTYWHPALRPCRPRNCRSHYGDVALTLPRSFVWLLQLFSFLLDAEVECVYEEVLQVERRLLSTKTPRMESCRSRTQRRRTPSRTLPRRSQPGVRDRKWL
ncbi:hypothetical protein LDENG_00111810 [Lucifuga dentata]|nr:hypothetical protein LDENG_00111810 [Lucifuga dentata]